IDGQLTVMSALEVLLSRSSLDSLLALTVTWLCRVPQSAASVVPLTWIVREAPEARSPKEQLSTPALMEQSALSWVQSTPVGRVSVRVTFFATPGPLLVTTIVNAAASPALTVPLSLAFTTCRLLLVNVIWALDVFFAMS